MRVALSLGAVGGATVWLLLGELGLLDAAGLDARRWLWIGVLAGVAVAAMGGLRFLTRVGVALLVAALLVQFAPWSPGLGPAFLRADSLPAGPADALMVLSASITDDGRLKEPAGDRLLEGLRLVKAGAAPRLVLSRIERTEGGRTVTSDADQAALIDLVVPGVEPLVVPATSTRTEALGAADLARTRGWRTLIVVTSPTHSRRACATFEAVGFTVICRPSPDRAVAWGTLRGAGDRTRAFARLVYERLAWAEYRVRGWVR
ncbi:MAG: YdcF family protein [Gemmatimonadales bacterium]